MRILDPTPGSTARRFILSGAIWFVFATIVGLTIATELVAPDLVQTRYFLFPRLRPVHVDSNVFGFLSMMLLGGVLYAVCRLSRAPLASERMGNLSMWLFNLAALGGAVTLVLGLNESHEYGEYILPIDFLIVAAMVLLLINVLRTLRRRREKLIYVTSWYSVGALVATLVVYVLGNMLWHIWTGKLTGMNDAEWAWFYGHNIFGTWITPLALAVCYFWLPREVDTPLYSHRLSMIGFWPYFAFYLQVGAHHLIEAPAPAWLKLIAEINSVGLLVPVYAFLTNQWMTLRGRYDRIPGNIVLKFMFAGTIFYFFTSTEGSLMALPSIERVTHFTEIVIGHAHIGLLGFAGFVASGAGYAVLREMHGRLWSDRLAHVQYWLMLIGVVGFLITLTQAGFIQGTAWRNGETVYRVLPEIMPDLILRAMFGCMVIAGAVVQLYNFARTMRLRPVGPASTIPSVAGEVNAA